jgi:hypothetical protein
VASDYLSAERAQTLNIFAAMRRLETHFEFVACQGGAARWCHDRAAEAEESIGPGSFDDFAKSPISALRFISLSLRRTVSTPHSRRFARLELGLVAKPSHRIPFYEIIIVWLSSTSMIEA